MSPQALARRWVIRAGAAAFTATLMSFSLQYATAATAGNHPGAISASLQARMYSPADPYSPLHNHPYRHGVIPSRTRLAKMRQWAIAHPNAAAASASNLNYGGGIDGIGVTTGPEKVYLVFYGSQWGTQGSSGGNVTLSNDANGAAPYLQNLFKGLGTNNELWSGVMTQYCDGVTVGAQTCPSTNTQHVAYPTGGALAGVWVDESTAEPSPASGHQLGVEAVNAAAHFGNTTAASNRDAQYDILSPPGTNPDNYQTGGFCAWHDYNGDTTLSGGAVSSPYGDIAFTNMPYVTDVGTSCGENFINAGSAGTLDGFSIVNGHEYSETVTDQNPAGGWTDSSGSENADKCAWNTGPGAPAANLTLSTGTFAMQSTWGNDGASGAGNCEFTHAIVTNPGGGGCSGAGSQLLGNPGFETGSASPWTSTAGVINPNGAGETAHSGSWYAWLDGYGTTHTDTLSQSVTIPAGCTNTTFSFWLHIDTAETTTTTAFDVLTITINGTTIATFSNLNHITGYLQHTYSIGSHAGSTITIKFTGTEDSSLQTSFVVDDTAVTTG